jgi:gamma-glutamylcysteine synthetase
MNKIYNHVVEGFESALASKSAEERRIGAELKFPLVDHAGNAGSFETVCQLWNYLICRGWRPVVDPMTKRIVGARKRGPHNDTIAGCETGYCKMEFSLAHVPNLFELEEQVQQLRAELEPFCEDGGVHMLGYGIQPMTPPTKKLMMKKRRTSPWSKAFGTNRHISKDDGHDIHLFTINAASHVHVSVALEEAVDVINVLNGFAGAQIALTANSNIWRGRIDPNYKCVAEKFWDWWMPEGNRVGVPTKPFENLKDYCQTIAELRPVYVNRAGRPIVLKRYKTFAEYFRAGRAVGIDPQGKEVSFVPKKDDIDLHSTCYWYNARLSRYYTVENRVNDQQPPHALVCIAALTLGLVSALREAKRRLSLYDWQTLRAAREAACRDGLSGEVDKIRLNELAGEMLHIARRGLVRRGLGEERFLEPLQKRISEVGCPADQASRLFQDGGIENLLTTWKI